MCVLVVPVVSIRIIALTRGFVLTSHSKHPHVSCNAANTFFTINAQSFQSFTELWIHRGSLRQVIVDKPLRQVDSWVFFGPHKCLQAHHEAVDQAHRVWSSPGTAAIFLEATVSLELRKPSSESPNGDRCGLVVKVLGQDNRRNGVRIWAFLSGALELDLVLTYAFSNVFAHCPYRHDGRGELLGTVLILIAQDHKHAED